MKKLLPLLFVVIFAVNAHAETLTLKNGSKVIGKILSKDGKKVRIEVDGAPMTYYMDEIDNLDGASMKADAPVVVPNALPVAAKIEPEAENVVAEPKTVAAAKITPVEVGKKALILKFIDVFGTKVAMTQNLQAMTENLPADNPDYQKIKSGINVDEIIERLIPIYDKYFSEEDLKDWYGGDV